MPPDERTVGVSIRSTPALRDRNGTAPEQTIKRYVERAVEMAGHSPDVVIADSVDAPPEDVAHCSGETYGWWRDTLNSEAVPVRKKDANILMTDSSSGGCGAVGGWVATCPGKNITSDMVWQETGTGAAHSNIHATLHELGHNLGVGHDLSDESGTQHAGRGWNQTWLDILWWSFGRWHRTPMVTGNDTTNMCGEPIPKRKHDSVVHHQYYTDCFWQHAEITK